MMKRVTGSVSSLMGLLMRRKANALGPLGRFAEARVAVLKSMEIYEHASGRSGEGYISGLKTLADILLHQDDFKGALKHVLAAKALLPPTDSRLLGNLLNLQAACLANLNRYQEALIVRIEMLALSRRVDGPNHTNFAAVCQATSKLYAQLNQMKEAVSLARQAHTIYVKTLGPAHVATQHLLEQLYHYEKALTDPAIKKQIVPTKNRMCNIVGCNVVEESMNRCLSCLTHYLCENHEEKIHEHVFVCTKFPDVLPDEKKGKKIVKCRRCRKETKLMKCGQCGNVWYCGAQCQKEDWKRHKVFCGKK